MKLFKVTGNTIWDKVLYFEDNINNLYSIMYDNYSIKIKSVYIGENKWPSRRDCKMVYL